MVIEPTNVPQFFIASLLFLPAGIFILFRQKRIVLPGYPLTVILFAFYFMHLASVFWSLNTADAVFESQKVLLGITALIIFLNFFDSAQNDDFIFKSLIVTTIIYCLFSLVEYLTRGHSDMVNSSNGSLLAGHKNLLSSFVFLLFPFSTYGAIKFSGKWRLFSFLAVLLIVLCISIFQTRSVYLAVIISVLVFFVFFFTEKWKERSRVLVLSSVLLAGMIIVTVLFLKAGSTVSATATNTTASLHERYHLWNNTFQLIEENPFLGVGSGNWQYNYSKFSVEQIEVARFYQTVFKSPHNDFLSVLAETGIAGFLLLMLALFIIAGNTILKILKERNLKLILLFSALAGLVTDSFFSFPKDRISHILLVALILAVLIQTTRVVKEIRRLPHLLISFVLVGLCFNLFVGWKRISGEYYTLKLLEAQAKMNPREVIDYGYKAMSPFYKTDPTCTPVYSYIGWGYNVVTDLDSLLIVSEAAFELSPYDYKVLSNYGYVLLRLNHIKSAETILMEANRINPGYEPVILNLSVLEFNRGAYQKSLNWLESIRDYEIKYPGNLERINEKLSD